MKNNVQRTRNAEIFTDELGIVHQVADQGASYTVEDTLQEFRIYSELMKGKKLLLFIDISGVRVVPRECRVMYAGDEAASLCFAVALLAGSPLSSVIGNFFMGLNNPKMHVKLFTSKETGIRWLLKFMDKQGDQ